MLSWHDLPVGDVLGLLRSEFDADDGTFLLKLRSELVWDQVAFVRLEHAMRHACEVFQGRDELDRWVAEGFYFASHWVKDWTQHPNFPRPEPSSYYDASISTIEDLANWFFRSIR